MSGTTASTIAVALGDHLPTPEQQAAIEAPLAPTLVVAGAGSGKTATMAARVVHLVVNGQVRPEEMLGLTFTRKAAGELSDRVRGRLAAARRHFPGIGDLSAPPTLTTYNAFAAALVRDHALRVGADPDATLITGAGAWQLMDRIVQSWPDEVESTLTPATVVDRALKLAEALRTNLVSVEEAREGLEGLLEDLEQTREGTPSKRVREPADAVRARLALLDIVRAYETRKVELGLVEFSDQVALACAIAHRVPAVGALLRAQYRVVLLDEFQDTSVAQLGLLADLFGPGHPVMAVGDPHQAIYGWRGASAASLTGFRERFALPGRPVATLSLATSWRNDHAVLSAANALSAPLRHTAGPEGALLGPLDPHPGAEAGEVGVSVALTQAEEAAEIARWIGERWRPGSSAAVLCRARKQFPQVLRALRERGLPATVVGLSGLLHTPEVVDLRSALQVAHDAARGDALMRLLTGARLGLADLRVLADWAGVLGRRDGEATETATIVEALDRLPPSGWHTVDGLALSPEGRRRAERVRAVLRGIRGDLDLPLVDLVSAAERRLGLDIEVAARAGTDPVTARANLDAFAGHAASWAAGALTPTLGGFLAWLDAAEANENGLDIEQVEVATDAVQVLTVHAAKGLEWDVVAVAGLSDTQFPSCRRTPAGVAASSDGGWVTRAEEFPYPLRGDAAALPALRTDAASWAEFTADLDDFKVRNLDHQLTEERRLAYVAATRARHHLLLSASRFLPGVARAVPLSRFLDDVAAVPSPGFAVVPAPPAEALNPEMEEVRRAEYPLADPVGARRARLDLAAAAVRRSRDALGSDTHALAAAALALGPEPPPPVRRLADEAAVLLAERMERRAEPALDLDGHLSASAAIALTADPEDFARRLRRPVPFRPQPRARLGSEFHAWVEHHFEQPALLHPDEDLDRDEATAGLADLRRNFLASPWAARRPIAVEADLETLVAGRVIRCRIDAVFAGGDRIEVVDWKTGRPPSTRAELDVRQMQLALYRLAWSRASGVPLTAISGAFFHVADGVTVRADPWTEAQVEERFARALVAAGVPG